MIRWLINESDTYWLSVSNVHPHLKNMIQLNKKGLDQPYWVGVNHEAFLSYLNSANLSLNGIHNSNLKVSARELSRASIPSELKNNLRRILLDEGLLESKFELELLLSTSSGDAISLSWDSVCQISAKGIEGVFQSIKTCWANLFRATVFKKILNLGIDLSQINVFVVIRKQQNEILRGKAFSYSPRCTWDMRNAVVSYEKDNEMYLFLVDRQSYRTTYYGRGLEATDDAKKESSTKISESHNSMPHDKMKRVAEYLMKIEAMLESPMQLDWVMTSDLRIILNRVSRFERSPSANMMSSSFNTTARNLWDFSLLNWKPESLLKPLWFSLLPRNFRTLSIHYMRQLGVKDKVSSEYEKVFRGFWGLLRGRLYVNLAALHRFLGLGQQHELLEEIEVLSSIWMKRYDREERESWDFRWPEFPKYTKADLKKIEKNQKKFIKDWSNKIYNWIDQMHSLREMLVSSQWKDKNVSLMLEQLQQFERQFIPSLVPILYAELQYRNLMSWYFEGSQKPSMFQSWDHKNERQAIQFEGSWWERRTLEKKYNELELLSQIRPKYITILEDIYGKFRKYFDLMGQKYREMGMLEKSDDIFYLTLEELLAFEEGRSSTISWPKLVEIRKEEYRIYSNDFKIPEVWMTTGLVGLATKFPDVISIKERRKESIESNYAKNPETNALVSSIKKNLNLDIKDDVSIKKVDVIKDKNHLTEQIYAQLGQLDFVEDSSKINNSNKENQNEDESKLKQIIPEVNS